MTNLPALAIAPAAQAWLAQTRSARVLNVFDRACNLVNPQGEVLSLVASPRGLTPFALVVSPPDPAPFRVLTASSAVRVRPEGLAIGPLTIECSAARLWDSAPDWTAIRRYCLAGGNLDEIAAQAFAGGPPGSLLELLAPASEPGALPAALAARARQGARDLLAGLRAGSADQCASGVELLAGVGGGLTPAGDDFIVGVLLAAWAGRYGAEAVRLGAQVAETAAQRTTTLSGAYLRAAARGECSAYWHDLFEALLHPDRASPGAALVALLAVGHTSGADALAGFLAVGHAGAALAPHRAISGG